MPLSNGIFGVKAGGSKASNVLCCLRIARLDHLPHSNGTIITGSNKFHTIRMSGDFADTAAETWNARLGSPFLPCAL